MYRNAQRATRLGAALLLLGLSLAGPAAAQNTLHAGLIKNKGYTAGSALAASGMMRFEGDTVWSHIGFNHPRVFGIGYDPANPEVVFLSAGNGVLRTLDGGRSWRIVTGWEVTEAQDVIVDPNEPRHVYTATAYGVWRSEDGGDTWIESNAGIPTAHTYTHTVVVDRTRPGRLFAATHGGIYASEDGAHSWRLVAAEGIPTYGIAQGTSDPKVWIVGSEERGVLLSSDGGLTWRFARGDMAGNTIYGVDVDPTDARRLAAAGWGTGVFVSTNGGRSWTQRLRGLPVEDIYEVLFDPDEPGRLWAATVEQGIFRSDDLGRRWVYAGMYGTLVFDLTFVPDQPE